MKRAHQLNDMILRPGESASRSFADKNKTRHQFFNLSNIAFYSYAGLGPVIVSKNGCMMHVCTYVRRLPGHTSSMDPFEGITIMVVKWVMVGVAGVRRHW
jgi:hypothetical protein